ncbi:Ubiquitin-conjugating enzyme E2-17 kDa [Cucumispora dikerogammari]|nr:Ubiquitin-conjugating enzyme E2-17 kDa [Cucumispora dikerogammari]
MRQNKLFTRINHDLKEIRELNGGNEESLFFAEPINPNDITVWRAVLFGPPGTPYEGGTFYLLINIPSGYPFDPPKFQFKTRIFHCNIRDGEICLDILKNSWSSALSISKVILSISSLLSDPNPDDPLDSNAANLYNKDRKAYNAKAAEWTKIYATEQQPDF